jgi:hypothetical protein
MTSELKGLTRKQMDDFMSIKGAKNLKKVYEGRMVGKGNFFEDVYKGITESGKKVNDFLKNTKLISKGSKLAKYILPAIATVLGPEVLAGIPIAEKVGSVAGDMGYGAKSACGGMYSDMRDPKKLHGTGYTVGLTTLGTGAKMNDSVLTISRNGTYQMTAPTSIENSGIGILSNNRVDAGAPQLSGIMSGLGSNKSNLGEYGSIFGSGLGSFGVIAPVSRIKV